MSTATEPLISTPTKCRLCGKTFQNDLLATASILGNDPQAKHKQIEAILKPLMVHLQKHHIEHIQQSQVAGGELAGYLSIVFGFEMDPNTAARLNTDFTRWKIRQLLTRPESKISDERIGERVEEVMNEYRISGEDIKAAFVLIMKQMRDTIEERERYKISSGVSR